VSATARYTNRIFSISDYRFEITAMPQQVATEENDGEKKIVSVSGNSPYV
jgi:hypothetical protein